MLLGEHAILYGQPCLVTAINKGLTVSMEKTDDGKVTVAAPESPDTRFVEAAVRVGCEAWGIRHKGLRIQTQSELGAYGFGSSSAATVATLEALRLLFHREVEKQECFNVAKQVVLAVQGAGSGFDVAAAIWGGTLYFADGGNIIEPLSIKGLPLTVGYTGVKADTTTLIAEVSKKRKKYPEKVDRIFQAIGKLVGEAKTKILEEDWERVGKLMDFNQEYLRDLGVSTQKLEDLILAAKQAGALGAKLSGAGGGDCMICLATSDKRQKTSRAIQETGGEVIDVAPNAEGVKQETSDDQGELLIVVDKDDRVLGYRTRYDCHHDPSLIHRTAGVVIFDDSGRVLLQKRSATKDMGPGLWGISAAGHVARGQSYDEAIHRELKEELGADIPVTPVGTYLLAVGEETEMSAIYRAVSNGPFHPDPKEVDHVAFVHPKELPRKMLAGEIRFTTWAEQVLKKSGVLP